MPSSLGVHGSLSGPSKTPNDHSGESLPLDGRPEASADDDDEHGQAASLLHRSSCRNLRRGVRKDKPRSSPTASTAVLTVREWFAAEKEDGEEDADEDAFRKLLLLLLLLLLFAISSSG
jgi:hypothetical protein